MIITGRRIFAIAAYLLVNVATSTLTYSQQNPIHDIIETSHQELGILHQQAGKSKKNTTTNNLGINDLKLESCRCIANDLEQTLTAFNTPEPPFLPAYQSGKAQTITLMSQITGNSACQINDGTSLCERLSYKLFDGETFMEITAFPFKGLTLDSLTYQLTLQPQSEDPIGRHKVMLSSYFQTQNDVTRTVKIDYVVTFAPEYQLEMQAQDGKDNYKLETRQPRQLQLGTPGLPGPPQFLAKNPALTTGTVIALTWDGPTSDGGTPVIDYQVFWDQATYGANYVVLASGITATSFQTSTTMTPNKNHFFKVLSRNAVGFSTSFSNEAGITLDNCSAADERSMNLLGAAAIPSFYYGNNPWPVHKSGCDGIFGEFRIGNLGDTWLFDVQFPEPGVEIDTVVVVFGDTYDQPNLPYTQYGIITNVSTYCANFKREAAESYFSCPSTVQRLRIGYYNADYNNANLREIMLYSKKAIQMLATSATLNGVPASQTISKFISGSTVVRSSPGKSEFVMNFPGSLNIQGVIFIYVNAALFDVASTSVSVLNLEKVKQTCDGFIIGQYVEYNCNSSLGSTIQVNYDGLNALAWDSIGVFANCDCSNISFDPTQMPGSTEALITVTSAVGADPVIMKVKLDIASTVEKGCGKDCGSRKLRLYASMAGRLRNLQTVTEITDLLPYNGIAFNSVTGEISVPLQSIVDGIQVSVALDVTPPLASPNLVGLPTNSGFDPCVNTVMRSFNVTSMINTALYGPVVQKIDYQLDTVSINMNKETFCGVPKYAITVLNRDGQTFVGEQKSFIYLDSTKIDFSDVGVWNATLTAYLPKYRKATFSAPFQVTMLNPCFQSNFTKINLDSMGYLLGDSNTTQDFILANDTVSQNLTQSYLCGIPEVKVSVLAYDNQNFVSVKNVKGNKYQISVQTNDTQTDVGRWFCNVEASLPLYGRNIRYFFIVTISKIDELPYFFGYTNDYSLPTINAVKGEIVSLSLPQIRDDDTDLKLVKLAIKKVTPVFMTDQVKLELVAGQVQLIANLSDINVKLLMIQLTLNDQIAIHSYQQIINVNLDATVNITENLTQNNTNLSKFDVFVVRGNQTFVEVKTANGTQLWPLPHEEPIQMEDRVYDEETSAQPTFEALTMTSSVSLQKFKEMRFRTVKSSDGVEQEIELCIPTVTQVSRKGSLEILFNRDIVPLSELDKFNIENSGIIQFQVIPASKATKAKENSSKLAFSWAISSQSQKGFKIQLTFANTGFISASSSDADQLRVIFVNASRFIKCSAPAGSARRLTSVTGKIIGGSGGSGKGTIGAPGQLIDPDSIPEGSQLVNSMPPQSPANETIAAEEASDDIGQMLNTVVVICFVGSLIIGFPLADVFGSINSLQMITLLPFNKVTFTAELYFAFSSLNTLTGFDYTNPWQWDDQITEMTGKGVSEIFGFTETDCYNDQFAWMGADQANFIYNSGSLSFVLILIMVHTVLIPLAKYLIARGYSGPGRIIHKMDMEWDDVIGRWVILWHESFITFIQCGVIVILMLNLQAPSFSDNGTLSLGLYFVLPITLIYPAFLIWFSFYHIRRLVAMNQRDLFLAYQEKIPMLMQEKNNRGRAQMVEFFDKQPKLKKKFKGLYEEKDIDFAAFELCRQQTSMILQTVSDKIVVGNLGQNEAVHSRNNSNQILISENSKSRSRIETEEINQDQSHLSVIISQEPSSEKIPKQNNNLQQKQIQDQSMAQISSESASNHIQSEQEQASGNLSKVNEDGTQLVSVGGGTLGLLKEEEPEKLSVFQFLLCIPLELLKPGDGDHHFDEKDLQDDDDLKEVKLNDYKNEKNKSFYAIMLAERKDIKIVKSKKLGRYVFVKDTQGLTEEEEEIYRAKTEARFGGLFENLNMNKFDAQYANVIFIVRRVVLLYAMLWMESRSFLQVMIYMIMSLVNLLYIGYSMPFIEKRSNCVELIDEATVQAIAIFQMALESGMVDDIDTKTGIGYTIICLIIVNMCFSMYFVVIEMTEAFIETVKEKYHKIKEYCKKKHGKKEKVEEKYILEEDGPEEFSIQLRLCQQNESSVNKESLSALLDSLNNDKNKALSGQENESLIDDGSKMAGNQGTERQQIQKMMMTGDSLSEFPKENGFINNTYERREISFIHDKSQNDFSLPSLNGSKLPQKNQSILSYMLKDDTVRIDQVMMRSANLADTLRQDDTVRVDLVTMRRANLDDTSRQDDTVVRVDQVTMRRANLDDTLRQDDTMRVDQVMMRRANQDDTLRQDDTVRVDQVMIRLTNRDVDKTMVQGPSQLLWNNTEYFGSQLAEESKEEVKFEFKPELSPPLFTSHFQNEIQDQEAQPVLSRVQQHNLSSDNRVRSLNQQAVLGRNRIILEVPKRDTVPKQHIMPTTLESISESEIEDQTNRV